jgi:hypothetical protein
MRFKKESFQHIFAHTKRAGRGNKTFNLRQHLAFLKRIYYTCGIRPGYFELSGSWQVLPKNSSAMRPRRHLAAWRWNPSGRPEVFPSILGMAESSLFKPKLESGKCEITGGVADFSLRGCLNLD